MIKIIANKKIYIMIKTRDEVYKNIIVRYYFDFNTKKY